MNRVPYPPPHATPETARWWDELERGRVVVPWCDDCEGAFFPPRAVCPACWGERLSWRPVTPTGSVVAHAVVHRPGHPAFRGDGHYTIAVVELADGVRVTMAVRDQQRVVVGQQVGVSTRRRDGVTVPEAVVLGDGSP